MFALFGQIRHRLLVSSSPYQMSMSISTSSDILSELSARHANYDYGEDEEALLLKDTTEAIEWAMHRHGQNHRHRYRRSPKTISMIPFRTPFRTPFKTLYDDSNNDYYSILSEMHSRCVFK